MNHLEYKIRIHEVQCKQEPLEQAKSLGGTLNYTLCEHVR